MQGSVYTYRADEACGSVILDDGLVLEFPTHALAGSGLLHLRVGQRVSIEVRRADPSQAHSPLEVTRVWIVGIGDDQPIR
ncbi:MAG TPA: hypothetical protein PLK69_03080 [Tetrasphaera sp.]|nr:hypothetical protein [Tetrasphaera sp.]